MSTFVSVILAISSLVLIISVVMQESSQVGLGTMDGSVGGSDWGANRGSSKKDILKRITMVSSAVFLISAIILMTIS